jgi:hypothetical protein
MRFDDPALQFTNRISVCRLYERKRDLDTGRDSRRCDVSIANLNRLRVNGDFREFGSQLPAISPVRCGAPIPQQTGLGQIKGGRADRPETPDAWGHRLNSRGQLRSWKLLERSRAAGRREPGFAGRYARI